MVRSCLLACALATIPLQQQIQIASRIYTAVNEYFVDSTAVGKQTIDDAYARFLNVIAAGADRRTFDLAAMRFMASLGNTHTGFGDAWLHGQYVTGISLRRFDDGRWYVLQSARPDVPRGARVTTIDGAPPDAFFERTTLPYVGFSSPRMRMEAAYQEDLLPDHFTIALSDGRTVVIRRDIPRASAPQPPLDVTSRTLDHGAVGYIRIPSFGEAKYEEAAINAVHAMHSAKTLIIDVRGNGGGNTPIKLLGALMDEPFAFWRSVYRVSYALPDARVAMAQHDSAFYTRQAFVPYSDVTGTFVTKPSDIVRPDAGAYTGKVVILTDRRCASACEDFVAPFHENHRALIVGDTTYGSSGQPYYEQFDNGMWFRVQVQRVQWPDGSLFEGVGVPPDVRAVEPPSDLTSGQDSVLQRALALAAA
jgi:carboxyl-terminal processing protease